MDLTSIVPAQRAPQVDVDDLTRQLAFTQAILSASPDLIFTLDLASKTVGWASRPFSDMLDLEPLPDPAEDTRRFVRRIEPRDLVALGAATVAAGDLGDGETLLSRFRVRSGDGTPRWFSRRLAPLERGADGTVVTAVCVLRDVTTFVETEQRLEHAGTHDPLTGLANRTLLEDRLGIAMARAERRGRHVMVLFGDLNGFKEINDAHGHLTGDAVLTEVARRLEGCSRSEDTVARLGGDEFVVVAELDPANHSPESVAERVQLAVAAPISTRSGVHEVTMAVGWTIAIPPMSVEEILDVADLAMYDDKQRWRGLSS